MQRAAIRMCTDYMVCFTACTDLLVFRNIRIFRVIKTVRAYLAERL